MDIEGRTRGLREDSGFDGKAWILKGEPGLEGRKTGFEMESGILNGKPRFEGRIRPLKGEQGFWRENTGLKEGPKFEKNTTGCERSTRI